MAKMIWVLVALLSISIPGISRAQDDSVEVRYQVVSGRGKGGLHFSVIFFTARRCDFTEYWPNGIVYFGSVGGDDDYYSIDSLAFPFRYSRELRRNVAVPFEGGEVRYLEDRLVRIGSVELRAHAYSVRTRLQSRTLYISDDYSLPIGYDSKWIRVRVMPSDLDRLRSLNCRGLGPSSG